MEKAIKATFAALLLLALPAHAGDTPSPEHVEGAKTIGVEEAKRLFENEALFIDTRKDKDWEAGRIPGAEHLDVKKNFTPEALAEVAESKDEAIVVYCNGKKCHRSSKGAKLAVEWGYTNVHYFRDGFPAWKAAGYPVE